MPFKTTRRSGFIAVVQKLAVAAVLAFLLGVPSKAQAADIKVVAQGDDLLLSSPGVFSMRFQKSRGGGITEYYDLKHDPSSKVNIAAQQRRHRSNPLVLQQRP